MLEEFMGYCMGLFCCLTSLSYSLVPTCPWKVVRFSRRELPTACDASRMCGGDRVGLV